MCGTEKSKCRLHLFLLQEYNKTKFPFFTIGELCLKNVFNKEEANMLYKQGKIKIRKSISCTLIELILD